MCTIGTKIRKLRIAHNLSQPELSKMLNISQSTLCNIESGDRKKIDFSLIQKICVIFKIDLNYFTEVSPNLEGETNINTVDSDEVVTEAILNLVDQFKPEIVMQKFKSLISG